jgi:hypothetical protein
MRTKVWMATVVMAAALTAPARADRPCEAIATDFSPSGASLDTSSFPDQVAPLQCPEADEIRCARSQPDVWRVTADALFLQRNDPAAGVLVIDAIDDTEILNANDLDFGVHAGFDMSLTRRFGDRFAVEARYFGIAAWDAQAATITTPGRLLQVNSTPPRFPEAGTSVEADYSSGLHNVEINGHWLIREDWALLAGFRYAELDEDFAMSSSGATNPFLYQTTTRNRLSGFQLGTAFSLWDRGGPLSVDGVLKSGIFGNRAAQRSEWDGGAVLPPVSDAASETAFIGEIGAIGSYRLTNHLSVRAGYRLLWIDRVAWAAAQIAASDFDPDSLQGIDATGDAFYHGAFVGLEYVR